MIKSLYPKYIKKKPQNSTKMGKNEKWVKDMNRHLTKQGI